MLCNENPANRGIERERGWYLVQHVVEASDDHGEHGLEVGVDLLRPHLHVAHRLGGDGLDDKVDDAGEDGDKGCRGILGGADGGVEPVVDPLDLYALLCWVVREGEVNDGGDCLDKDVPRHVDEDQVGGEDCLASLPNATEGPVLVGEGAYAPRDGALLGTVAQPLHVEVDAAVAGLVVALLPELVCLPDLEGLEGPCCSKAALEV